MKKTKPKSGKSPKDTKKASSNKRAKKKELESGMAEKFLDVVSNLGHDAERIAKDIKKMSKELAKKLSEKIKSNKSTKAASSKRKSKNEKQVLKREVKASRKDAAKEPEKIERVVETANLKPEVRPAAKAVSKPAIRKKPVSRTASPVTASSVDIAPKPRVSRAKPAAAKAATETKAPVRRRTRQTVAPKNETIPTAVENEAVKTDVSAGTAGEEPKSE